MEFYYSSILKMKIIPAFIREAYVRKEESNIKKSINILSDLSDIYISLKNCNHSLISSIEPRNVKNF